MSDSLAEVSKTKPDNGLSVEQLKESRALLNNFHGGSKIRVQDPKIGILNPSLTLIKPDKKDKAA